MNRRRFSAALVGLPVALSACGSSAVMTGTRHAPWSEQPLQLDGLHGTLTLPDGHGPVPAVLLLPGSGPVDRDGNLPGMRSQSLARLAQGLAERGIASLRADKRGIGASAKVAEAQLRFQTYVADALAWLRALRAQPRVGNVGLMAHSEGALVATLAAQHAEVGALVLLAGAGEPAATLISRQLAASGWPPALQQAAGGMLAQLLQQQPVADVPPELMALLRPSVQPYLMSWLPIDPAAELARVRCPALIVQGTHDLQVGAVDAQRLHAAQPGAGLAFIDGMNHVLKSAPLERVANLRTYADPDLPLAPGLLPLLADFLHRNLVPAA